MIKEDCDTTKTRVMFDVSAKDYEKQLCLNDYLEEKLPHIFAVLIEFKSKSIALTAFLQIGIISEDSCVRSVLTLTKCNVLRFRAKIYDPLGLLSPLTIRLKLLFQELCHDHTKCDSTLKHECEKKYLKLIS